MGLNDEDLQRLECQLLVNPQAGSVIRGTGKLRKLRVALPHRGKRASSRVCYVDFVPLETIVLFICYAKNDMENLNQAQIQNIKRMINQIETNLYNSKSGGIR